LGLHFDDSYYCVRCYKGKISISKQGRLVSIGYEDVELRRRPARGDHKAASDHYASGKMAAKDLPQHGLLPLAVGLPVPILD
jgi:hypothetical protein